MFSSTEGEKGQRYLTSSWIGLEYWYKNTPLECPWIKIKYNNNGTKGKDLLHSSLPESLLQNQMFNVEFVLQYNNVPVCVSV